MMRVRNALLSTTCLCAVAAFSAAQAADFSDTSVAFGTPGSLPAVSAPNGKIAVFGGSQDGGLYGVTGSISVPLGFPYGFQIDGLVGSGEDAAFYGVGGHLFWRDPAKGLLGLYGSYVTWDLSQDGTQGADVGKAGVEGEAYLGRFTLEGLAAYQFGTNTGFAGKAILAYYPMDNWRIDGGVNYLEGPGAIGTIGTEWQPHAGKGLSLFAKGSIGQDDYKQVLGGVRYYFGDPNKSLIDRQRQDDPDSTLPADLFTTGCPDGTVFDGTRCDAYWGPG